MVGKGVDTKSSRIFQQCYVKCCKLQNLTPITSIIPTGNGRNIDFCVDRIKYNEWAPILNALSCDLSLHSISIKCRQQSKTVLENIDSERLAKTISKKAVILTRFMLSNLVEAIAQCLSNSSLLTSLLLDGLPLRVPYLNPIIDALFSNATLQHLYLTKCYIGDAGCMGICKALRCLPNVLTLDLSSCDLTSQGAAHIADLVKKIHRYSENWKQTLRYRLPELDTMSGLRRITLCGNTNLGDVGASQLMETLSDDLWIKALDLQCCGLTEASAQKAKQLLDYNSTIVVLDLRQNSDIYHESINAVRLLLRQNEQGLGVQQYRWLSSTPSSYSESKSSKSSGLQIRNTNTGKERCVQSIVPYKYSNKIPAKAEKNYQQILEEQLREEISHRQQLEELNLQLIDQMKQLKQQQIRIWSNKCEPFVSSGSEQSIENSVRSTEYSSGSDGSSFVPIDQNTLSYIQQAFKDIYSFIKTNQCQGKCKNEQRPSNGRIANAITYKEEVKSISEQATNGVEKRSPKKSVSTHGPRENCLNVKKVSKSECRIKDSYKEPLDPHMFERQMGDTQQNRPIYRNGADILDDVMNSNNLYYNEKLDQTVRSQNSSAVSDSEGTLTCTPSETQLDLRNTLNAPEAFYSSEEDV